METESLEGHAVSESYEMLRHHAARPLGFGRPGFTVMGQEPSSGFVERDHRLP
jgi:hypothetical protein